CRGRGQPGPTLILSHRRSSRPDHTRLDGPAARPHCPQPRRRMRKPSRRCCRTTPTWSSEGRRLSTHRDFYCPQIRRTSVRPPRRSHCPLTRRELDWSRCVIDSVNMRALKKGDLTAPESCRLRQIRLKIHLITDRNGLPLSVGISGANVHDSQALIPLVKGIPPVRSRRGPRRRRPAKLHSAKDY